MDFENNFQHEKSSSSPSHSTLHGKLSRRSSSPTISSEPKAPFPNTFTTTHKRLQLNPSNRYFGRMPEPYGKFFDDQGKDFAIHPNGPPRDLFTNSVALQLPAELTTIHYYNSRKIGRTFPRNSKENLIEQHSYWGCKLCGTAYPEFQECPDINPAILVLFLVYCKNPYCQNALKTPPSSEASTPDPQHPPEQRRQTSNTGISLDNTGNPRTSTASTSACTICGVLMGDSSNQLCGKTRCLFL